MSLDEVFGCILFANANSGDYSPENLEGVERTLGLGQGKLECHSVVTKDPRDLKSEVQKVQEQGNFPDLVGIIGGDGSVMEVITAIENTWSRQPAYYLVFPDSGGTMKTAHNYLSAGKSSQEIAKYVAKAVSLNEPLRYKTMPVIDVTVDGIQNKRCQTVGFGIVPNLLLLYEGMTVERCLDLERELQQGKPGEYHEIAKKFTKDLRKPNRLSALKIGASTFRNIFHGHNSWEQYFFSRGLDVEIVIDDEEVETFLPERYQQKLPTGIYAASFGQVNIGLPKKLTLLPQADQDPEKIPAVFTYGSARQTALQVLKTVVGWNMDHASYLRFTKMTLHSDKAIACNVNGDAVYGKYFAIRSAGERKFIVG
ncbi:MAG: diacylglycerol kinase family protein [Nanoarchaeota archaeon]